MEENTVLCFSLLSSLAFLFSLLFSSSCSLFSDSLLLAFPHICCLFYLCSLLSVLLFLPFLLSALFFSYLFSSALFFFFSLFLKVSTLLNECKSAKKVMKLKYPYETRSILEKTAVSPTDKPTYSDLCCVLKASQFLLKFAPIELVPPLWRPKRLFFSFFFFFLTPSRPPIPCNRSNLHVLCNTYSSPTSETSHLIKIEPTHHTSNQIRG